MNYGPYHLPNEHYKKMFLVPFPTKLKTLFSIMKVDDQALYGGSTTYVVIFENKMKPKESEQ